MHLTEHFEVAAAQQQAERRAGRHVRRVRTLDELRALAPMLRKPQGPILIDCKITASVMAPFLLETVEHERRKS